MSAMDNTPDWPTMGTSLNFTTQRELHEEIILRNCTKYYAKKNLVIAEAVHQTHLANF